MNISSAAWKYYIVFQYVLSLFLYFIFSGLGLISIFVDLSFDQGLQDFFAVQKYMLMIFMAIFSFFEVAFTKVVRRLINIELGNNKTIYIDKKLVAKNEIAEISEMSIFFITLGVIEFNGKTRFFAPENATSSWPFLYTKKYKNYSIKILAETVR